MHAGPADTGLQGCWVCVLYKMMPLGIIHRRGYLPCTAACKAFDHAGFLLSCGSHYRVEVDLLKVDPLHSKQVAEALRERASRIYAKYGTLMLNTAGLSAEGIERKASARALFSKLLYLSGDD